MIEQKHHFFAPKTGAQNLYYKKNIISLSINILKLSCITKKFGHFRNWL